MNDRELLEMAAKAAGIKALRCPGGILRNCTGSDPAQNIFSLPAWSPLTDDGDALRLAVKTKIILEIQSHIGKLILEDGEQPSIEHAVRRAIVRAAAEIGKAMP